jgi:chromosome segregation ATPase
MAEHTDTNQENVDTPPVDAQQESIQTTQPQGIFKTQLELDNEAKRIRQTTEAETKKQILAKLGLKPEDIEKLGDIKTVYESSLSDGERLNNTISTLQTENVDLKNQLGNKDFEISALKAIVGEQSAKADMIVKMAKGLKDDNTTIEEAIKQVMSMVSISNQATDTQQANQIPTGNPLQQPNNQQLPQPNPWKTDQLNMTEQAKIYKQDPELARKLAKDAGVIWNL